MINRVYYPPGTVAGWWWWEKGPLVLTGVHNQSGTRWVFVYVGDLEAALDLDLSAIDGG